MTKLIFAAALMMASMAFAHDYGQDQGQDQGQAHHGHGHGHHRGQSNTYVSWPKYDGVDVNNLCDDGEAFQTISPVYVCDSWTEIKPVVPELGPSDWRCDSHHYEHVTVSKMGPDCLEYGHTEVDAGQCIKHGYTRRSNRVLAERITDYGEYQKSDYFYYTIPACR